MRKRVLRTITSLVVTVSYTFFTQPAADAQSLAELSAGDLVINEIAWAGSTLSSTDEWVELYNSTDRAIELNGISLAGAGNVPLKGTIPPGGFHLVTDNPKSGTQVILGNLSHQTDSSLSISNSGFRIQLLRGEQVIDDVDTGGSAPFAGRSATSHKASMARLASNLPGSQPGSWYTSFSRVNLNFPAASPQCKHDSGSPGAPNPPPVQPRYDFLNGCPVNGVPVINEQPNKVSFGGETTGEIELPVYFPTQPGVYSVELGLHQQTDRSDISSIFIRVDNQTVVDLPVEFTAQAGPIPVTSVVVTQEIAGKEGSLILKGIYKVTLDSVRFATISAEQSNQISLSRYMTIEHSVSPDNHVVLNTPEDLSRRISAPIPVCVGIKKCMVSLEIANPGLQVTTLAIHSNDPAERNGFRMAMLRPGEKKTLAFPVIDEFGALLSLTVVAPAGGSLDLGLIQVAPLPLEKIVYTTISLAGIDWNDDTAELLAPHSPPGLNGTLKDVIQIRGLEAGGYSQIVKVKRTSSGSSAKQLLRISGFSSNGKQLFEITLSENQLTEEYQEISQDFTLAQSEPIYVFVQYFGGLEGRAGSLSIQDIHVE